jgi:F-type H+-transporting ATPase subunit delta
MSDNITIARPYAQAAFEEAEKQSDLKGWAEILSSLAEAVCNAEVRAVITSPRVAKIQLESLMAGLLGSEANTHQQNFIRVVVDNQRLLILPEIAAIFESLRAEAEKSINVVVDTAFELTAAQQDKIAESLRARMGRKIKLVCKIDKTLLGGVVIRAGDKVIDGSARTRLGELANALA